MLFRSIEIANALAEALLLDLFFFRDFVLVVRFETFVRVLTSLKVLLPIEKAPAAASARPSPAEV